MNKRIKILIVSVLISVILLCCFGCKNNESSFASNSEVNPSEIFKPTEEETVATKESYLVKNGVSPYKIVVPENASNDVKIAADELQYFFSLPTGVELPIVSEAVIGSDTKGKYLSVGDTIIAREAGLSSDYDTLGSDGYRVKTHGNAIAMLGGRDSGTIFSVYGYLKKQFGLKIYAADWYTYDTVTEAKLADLDWTDIPDIPIRTGGTYLSASWSPWALNSEAAIKQRSRYRMTCFWGEPYGLLSHTHFTILPPSIYYEEHPDWYVVPIGSEENTATWQLDVTNQEMWPIFIERFKAIIESSYESDHDYIYYQLGVEDNGNEPLHETYQNLKAELGGVASGVQLYFHNYVVQHINAWTAEKYPGQYFEFSFFAYGGTFMPAPVKNVGTNEKPVYEPYQYTDPYDGKVKDLKPVDNLVPMVTPIMEHRSHGYLDETNPSSKKSFEGWGAISKGMQVWAYNAYFADYLAPFNVWSSYKENYMDYKELGVSFVFEHVTTEKTPNFLELQQYLISQLMWDTTLDTETLIIDFMSAYYGAGWEDLYEYFTLMRNRLHEMELLDTSGGRVYAYINSNLGLSYETKSDWFPLSFLMQCEKLLEQALSKVEVGSEYYKHLEYARIPHRYLLLSLAWNSYEPTVYREMVYDFQRVIDDYGAGVYYDELHTKAYADLISDWLSKVA